MNDQIFKGKLEELIPKSIDNIIRENRDKLRLEIVKKNEMETTHKNLAITNFKGALNDVLIYRRRILINDSSSIAAIGLIDTPYGTQLRHTSSIVAYDSDSKVILTHSGSHYVINNFLEGDPNFSFLTFICATLNHEGVGSYFGVPPFFY